MTQYITRNTSNTLIFPLTERVTLTSPYFLFEFKSIQSGQVKYCIMANTSSYTGRYDKFVLIENTTENPTGGQIKLEDKGQYIVRIWEQSSASNLTPAGATTLLRENEMIFVRHSKPTISTYVAPRTAEVIYRNGAV